MENKTSMFEPLFEKAEQYTKANFELIKLKSVDKTADVASTIISRLLLVIILSLFILALNIAAALWLGDILGKTYFGFLVVAAFYLLIGIIMLLLHPAIKIRIQNSIIKQMLN